MASAETIVALSSGRLPAGVAVVRVSGPRCRFAVETIIGLVPPPRFGVLKTLKRPDGSVLDRGLVLFFPGPDSFTGEDVVEFQIHGGRAVVAALLEALTSMEGVRHADAGEFTRRAFLNGKLDLTETEALADLINAETEAQRRFAVMNAGGAQNALYLGWRQRLIHARAMIEAEIDFADEDDVPGSVADAVWLDARSILSEIKGHVEGFRAAEIIREGLDVVILGAPNAGKSSLLNALARREAAIVTDQAGTTRDLIEVALDIDGFRIRVTDTAGIRDGASSIEAIGIERALVRANSADVVLLLEDMETPVPCRVDAETPVLLKIGTKLDLLAEQSAPVRDYDIALSTMNDKGLSLLVRELGRRAAAVVGEAGDVLPSRLRHVELLKQTTAYLAEAVEGVGSPLELRGEALRLAGDELGKIVGAVDVEDLLDVIFSQFCIGK